MKKLTLTNAEFTHLREIYLVELEKAQKRIEHLSAILSKIDLEYDPNVEIEPLEVERKPTEKLTRKKTARQIGEVTVTKPKSKKTVKKSKETRKAINKGKAKIKWNDFVMNTIIDRNTPTLSSEIQALAISKFKIKENDVQRVKQVISGALSKLVTVEKKLNTQKIHGSRVKWYGPVGWFGENSQFLPEYQEKINSRVAE